MTKIHDRKFNLVFAGELLPDATRESAQQTLADFFGVTDSAAMDVFFTGRRTALRRNISQAEALGIYRDLRSLGLMSEVIEVKAPANKAEEKPKTSAPALTAAAAKIQAGSASMQRPPRPEPPARDGKKPTGDIAKPRQNAVPKTRPTLTLKKKSQPEPSPPSTPEEKPESTQESKQEAQQRSGSKKRQTLTLKSKSASKSKLGATSKSGPDSAPKPQPKPQPKPKSSPRSKAKPVTKAKAAASTKASTKAKPARKQKAAAQKADTVSKASTASRLSESNASPTSKPESKARPEQGSTVQRETQAAAKSAAAATPIPAVLKQDRTAIPLKNTESGVAPNLFALRPALPQKTAAQMQETALLRALITGSLALALVILATVVALRVPATPADARAPGTIALASLTDNRLVLMTSRALLVHERSGLPRERIGAEDMGVSVLAPPLWGVSDNELLLNTEAAGGSMVFSRCDLAGKQCEPFFAQPFDDIVVAVTGSLIAGSVFVMSESGRIVRSDVNGLIEEDSRISRHDGIPRLLASDGLLFAPTDEGPLVGVYRPDRGRFGQQLDALMLLVPELDPPVSYESIHDLAMQAEANWALLQGPDTATALYRFDKRWGKAQRIEFEEALTDPYMFSWRDKLLLADAAMPELLRVASDGTVEASLDSELLAAEQAAWREKAGRDRLVRVAGIALPLLLAAICALLALLFWSAQRVLPQLECAATKLLDPMPGGVFWLPNSGHQQEQLRRITAVMLALPVAGFIAVSLAGMQGQTLIAFIPAGIAGAYAAFAVRRGCGGHLGLLGNGVIVVDHGDRYYFGANNALHHGPNVVLAFPVALPIGIPGLDNIDISPSETRLATKVSERTISPLATLGMLWQLGHPWGQALISVVVGWMLTITALVIIA